MTQPVRTLIVVATYNERENLPELKEAIFRAVPDADLLVIDDNSPDGTGQWCDEAARSNPRLRCLHRPAKLGLGTALVRGLQYAVDESYTYVVNLDADFSHDPQYLPVLLAGMEDDRTGPVDVMIGSRYVAGGGVEGWPRTRLWMSRTVNLFARTMLGLQVSDCSGSFRCYRVSALERVDLSQVRARGYAFFEEILWRLKRAGARFGETPIIFSDRQRGRSKINLREAASALALIARLGVRNRLGL
ncbi:MAG: polyprenol monophosphomannose synthase [Pirellulales bacterium]